MELQGAGGTTTECGSLPSRHEGTGFIGSGGSQALGRGALGSRLGFHRVEKKGLHYLS